MRNSNSAITNRRIQGLVNKASDEAGYYIPITYTQNDRRIVYEKMRNDRKLRLLVNLIVYRESFSALFKDGKIKLTAYYEFIRGPLFQNQLENLISANIKLEPGFSSVFVFQPEEITYIVEHFLGRLKMLKEGLERSQSEASAGPSEQPELEFERAIDQTVD